MINVRKKNSTCAGTIFNIMSDNQHQGNLCRTESSDGMYVDFKQHENIFKKGYILLFLKGCPPLNIKKNMDKRLFIRLKQPIFVSFVRQKLLRFFGKHSKHLNFLNFAK